MRITNTGCEEDMTPVLFLEFTIVRGRTGYENLRTSKAITKLLQLMLEGPQPCTILFYTDTFR